LTTAEAAIADNTSNCIGFIEEDHAGTYGSFVATVGTNSLQLAGNGDGSATPTLNMWASINLLSGDVVTATFSAGMGPFPGSVSTEFSLYSCDGTLIETIGPGASPLAFSAVTADGEYFIRSSSTASGMGVTYAACDVTFTSSGSLTVNPVIAQWDDSGTTRSLWACPKLLLPPLTESTGDWYADCAAAADIFANSGETWWVSNCVGYSTYGPATGLASFSYTATDGGTSLTHSSSSATGMMLIPNWTPLSCWSSFNADAGDIITVSHSTSGSGGTGESASASLYDDTGTLVETVSVITGASLVFSALPYTGKYTIGIVVSFEEVFIGGDITASATISSDGSFSVNPIQARYDLGLTCPGTLDCGDACP